MLYRGAYQIFVCRFLRFLNPFGEHGDIVVNHFHNATNNIDNLFPFSRTDNHLSAFQCRYDWRVVFQYFKGTCSTGHGHRGDIAFKNRLVWGNDGKSHVDLRLYGFCQQFFSFFDGVFNSTYQVEGRFGILIHFAINNHIESFDGFFDINQYAFKAGKLFGYVKRLR